MVDAGTSVGAGVGAGVVGLGVGGEAQDKLTDRNPERLIVFASLSIR